MRNALLIILMSAFGAAHFAHDDNDDEARLNAKIALVAARAVYLNKGSYKAVTPAYLKAEHPDMTFVDGPSTKWNVVSVKVVAPDHLRLAVYGVKTCWGVREAGTSGGGVATDYARREGPAKDCTATSFKDADYKEHQHVWPR